MSTLIPEIEWADFVRIVKSGKGRELKSCEVMVDGRYLFTAEIPHGDIFTDGYTRTRAEYLALKSNIAGGQDPSKLLKQDDPYPNLTKAREARKAKLEQKAGVPV